MPPQPLKSMRQNATVLAGASAAAERPELAQAAARAIAVWADIEGQFGGILTTMLGAAAAPAAAMFYALSANNAQLAALGAAAEVVLGKNSKELDLFDVILDGAATAGAHRHRFAHWVWAYTPELPSALLFVDPQAIVEHDMSSRVLIAPHDGHALQNNMDLSRILVYRSQEMAEAIGLLDQVSYCMGYFRMMTLHLSDPAESSARGDIYQRLLAQPWIGEALARLHDRRKSDPKARLARRRR